MKKTLIFIVFLVLATPALLLWFAGIPLRGVMDMSAVGTGLTAKLACSGYYLSEFSDDKNLSDIASYSPAVGMISLRHEPHQTLVASLYGTEARARYYPGLGCTLQHADMVDLTAIEVPALAHAAGAWPIGNEVPAADPQMQTLLDQMVLSDTQEGLDTRALLVVRRGQILAESYAGDIDANTPLLGWSMGKSVSALMVGRMEALGDLSRDDRGLFSPWLQDSRRDISVENMLQMSTGLNFSEPYVPGNDSTRMLFTAPSASDVAMSSDLQYAPGTHWSYSSGTSNLLTRLVSDRLGRGPQGLVDFFAAEIAQPLGLRNTTFELDASGVMVGSSYIYAPARDWARLALPMLEDGKVGSVQWLPKGWVQAASAPNQSDNDGRYGYQFWLNSGGDSLRWPNLQTDVFAMSGNRGQVVMIFPALDAVIVRLGWTAGSYPNDSKFQPIQALLKRS
ncbi:MAG: serine hydrolase [Halioglobus sp.]